MENAFFDPDYKDQFIGGISLPAVPFQIYIEDKIYANRHGLPVKQCLTVTDVRYVISKKQVRYNIREAIFDFPWNDNAIQILAVCFTN